MAVLTGLDELLALRGKLRNSYILPKLVMFYQKKNRRATASRLFQICMTERDADWVDEILELHPEYLDVIGMMKQEEEPEIRNNVIKIGERVNLVLHTNFDWEDSNEEDLITGASGSEEA